MNFKQLTSLICLSTASLPAVANKQATLLNEIFVSSNITVPEHLQANYSSRVFSQQDITESGAINLGTFLAQNTNIQVQPSYGNPFVSSLDMNGFGIESGHENIQIIVDGVTLNNIDGAPVQLSTINLQSIEQITVIRGAGSVIYGNGAAAGVIIIDTNNGFAGQDSIHASAQFGSYNSSLKSVAMRHTGSNNGLQFFVDADVDQYSTDGSFVVKADGTQNKADNQNLKLNLGLGNEKTQAIFSVETNSADITYPGTTALAQFKTNPTTAQTNGTTQEYSTQSHKLNISHNLTKSTKVDYFLTQTNKDSSYIDYNSRNDYHQVEHKLALKTQMDKALLQYGISVKNALRDGASAWSNNRTSRNDHAAFALLTYVANEQLTLNGGYRQQRFDYRYKDATTNNSQSDELNSFNLGANWKLANNQSMFVNLNHAFLAPNIDRFFNFGGSFNGFIKPMQTDTVTAGYKQQNPNSDLLVEAFVSSLKDEIYYNPATFSNTNIDRSSKYGLNLSYKQFYDAGYAGVSYSYINAKIDKEAGTNYSNKMLPGVAEHSVTLFAQYDFSNNFISLLPNHSLRFEHKQAANSYSISDFNNALGTQPGYQSSDISYKLSNKNFTVKMGINNLFDQANGLHITSAGSVKVYPTLFERTYFVKMQLDY